MGYALQGPQPRTQTTPPMDISLTHRLSFKQAKLTVLVAFILGTLLSLIQISLDYASEDASIDREIHSLLEISHNPAARISYNIDAELAQERRRRRQRGCGCGCGVVGHAAHIFKP